MDALKHHNCHMFKLNPKADPSTSLHANCGICVSFNPKPPAPVYRVCKRHDELVAWSRANCKTNWND